MPVLWESQLELKHKIQAAWNTGNQIVAAISPTGSGKTVVFSDILSEEPGASAAIAHRKELVSQMSMALARNGVRHRVIGSKDLTKQIVGMHNAELGTSYYDPSARCGVIGIDSLQSLNPCDPWLYQVRKFICDEGHHVQRENKWGRGCLMFPNAQGLIVTATGWRADGGGLGRGVLLPNGKWSNDGLADCLVEGRNMRWHIDNGFLTDYRIVAPKSDIDYSGINVTPGGDLSLVKLRAAVHKSTRIVGDVVKNYRKFASGMLGVTFAVDVEAAIELADAFRESDVTAEVISANTPDTLRTQILAKFARREIMMLVNVDLFGEGFDLPAIEVVIMVRKTESKGLFDQQFGRALRVMVSPELKRIWGSLTTEQRLGYIAASSKPKALIIDHVGNVDRHKPPDSLRIHTLERRDRAARKPPDDVIPVRTCTNAGCLSVYERTHKECPYCHEKPEVGNRSAPEYVDGDLYEYSPELLAKLRGEATRIDSAPIVPGHLPGAAARHLMNVHAERQHAQNALRARIALWAGQQRDLGRPQHEWYRRFYFMFNVDVLTAQTLNRNDARALMARIDEKLAVDGIIEAT